MKYFNRALVFLLIFKLYGLLKVVKSSADILNLSSHELGVTSFYHLAVHKISGEVFIAAEGGYYKLPPDLKSPNSLGTTRLVVDPLESSNLIIDYEGNNLIICGIEYYDLTCMAYNYATNKTRILFSSRKQREDSFVFFDSVMFIGNEYQAENHSMIPKFYALFMEIAYGRSYFEFVFLTIIESDLRTITEQKFYENTTFNSVSSNHSLIYNLSTFYMYGFNSGKYNYVVIGKYNLYSTEGNKYLVELVRFCNDGKSLREKFTSIKMECRHDNGLLYNVMLAARVGKPGSQLARSMNISPNDSVLFALFSEERGMKNPGNVSYDLAALCIYSLHSIDKKYTENIQNCFNGNGYSLDIATTGSTKKIPCVKTNQTVDSNFCTSDVHLPIDGENAITASSILTFSSVLTAITFKPNGNLTDVFIGTETGHLKKLVVNNYSFACEYDDILIDELSPVNSDLQFSPTNDYLYVMTFNYLVRIPVSLDDCSKFTNFSTCIQTTPKYCGWCQSLKKCTTRCDCYDKGYSTWISDDFRINVEIKKYSSNESQIGFVETLEFYVVNMPPFMAEEQFYCVFAFMHSLPPVVAELLINDSHYIFSCPTPDAKNLPEIPSEKDHLNATLSIQTSDINDIAKMNIIFFDCTVYTYCEACLSSNFSCGWYWKNKNCRYIRENLTNVDHFNSCLYSSISSITSFWPLVGPWKGGINITIEGVNLGYELNHINRSIKVAGVDCIPFKNMYFPTNSSITCFIGELKSPRIREGPVEIKVNKESIRSAQNFKFVDVKIMNLFPKQGPTFGGTPLTIEGEYFNSGRSVAVFIGETPCEVFLCNSSTIQCITGTSRTENNESIRVEFDDIVLSFNNSFKYFKDEERDEKGYNIKPKGVTSGGIEFLLHDVKRTQSGQLFFYVHGKQQIYNSTCGILNDSSLWSCLSPSIPDINSASIDAKNPIEMNVSFTYDDINHQFVLVNNQSLKFKLYPDPKFYFFLNSSIEFYNKSFLIIFGENINNACQKTDFKVRVGNQVCEVRSISSNEVVCLLPRLTISDYNSLNEYNNIIVSIGPYFSKIIPKHSLPDLEFSPKNEIQKYTSYWYVVIIFAAVIVTIIASYFIIRKRIAMKYFHTVRNLQQQIDVMGMDAISTRQCIKHVIIKNKVVLDENSSKILKLPNLAIKNTSVLRSSVEISDETEYILPPDDKWEFPRKNLFLGRCLGEGEFGKVLRGEAKNILGENSIVTVAVKMLKDNHSDDDMINLVSEMEILKLIGMHDNVIRLLGCCTLNGPLFVITEYAAHGNLCEFLRKHAPADSEIITIDLPQETLIMFAIQVAKGMEHLSSINCVHRDLAARNILVFDDFVAKIADFGLSRDITCKEYYRKKKNGKVPIKWLAPESLCRNIYSTQSDVWSYGILLWEIFTLGGIPYPSLLDFEKLYQRLQSGYRMEMPTNCPVEIYSLMRKCWNFQPKNRPSFSTIVNNLQDIMSSLEKNGFNVMVLPEKAEFNVEENETDKFLQ